MGVNEKMLTSAYFANESWVLLYDSYWACLKNDGYKTVSHLFYLENTTKCSLKLYL